MAKSSPTEKRLEGGSPRKLRDFQRNNPANKRCFDCNEMVRNRSGRSDQLHFGDVELGGQLLLSLSLCVSVCACAGGC